jgi:hypothetical protein
MPNPEHLEILKGGFVGWNKWRNQNPKVVPNLISAVLPKFDFRGFNLSHVKFNQAQLQFGHFARCLIDETDFSNSDLQLTDFNRADLRDTDFVNADLTGSDFTQANIFCGKFQNTNLTNGDLVGTNLVGVDLTGASLKFSKLMETNFISAILERTNFEAALLDHTVFANLDLGCAVGLDSVMQGGPSTIGLDTIFLSRGKIPESFLRDAGVPDSTITYIPSLLGAVQAIEWHSCFISYSSKDDEFAKRLHSRMRQAGLRVWFAPEDMKGGEYSDEQIDRAIHLHDRLLLVLSENSIQSKWVEREIRKARKVERAEKRRKLFPITLTDYATLKKWECLDSDTGEDLAEEVRKYHIPDFSNWKNHDAFERAFARLEKDLRTSLR